jgi:hypothetical protein
MQQLREGEGGGDIIILGHLKIWHPPGGAEQAGSCGRQIAGPRTLVFPRRNALLLHDAYSSRLNSPRSSVADLARVSLPAKRRHNSLKKRLTSRILLRVALRRRLFSRVQRPCLKLPLRAPDGPPEPFAPPCIRQRARPLRAACRQGRPVRVLAPQRGALAILASRRSISA